MRFILWIFVLFIAIRLDFAIYRALHASNENYSFKNFRNEISNIPKQFPYTVKIFSRENQNTLSGFSCSGSIVGSMWILTAGHCVYGYVNTLPFNLKVATFISIIHFAWYSFLQFQCHWCVHWERNKWHESCCSSQ